MTFYESELQKVNYDSEQSFKIDKIIKKEEKEKHKHYYVTMEVLSKNV
jgi:hypothetical protein